MLLHSVEVRNSLWLLFYRCYLVTCWYWIPYCWWTFPEKKFSSSPSISPTPHAVCQTLERVQKSAQHCVCLYKSHVEHWQCFCFLLVTAGALVETRKVIIFGLFWQKKPGMHLHISLCMCVFIFTSHRTACALISFSTSNDLSCLWPQSWINTGDTF